jgi:hypothetical protein
MHDPMKSYEGSELDIAKEKKIYDISISSYIHRRKIVDDETQAKALAGHYDRSSRVKDKKINNIVLSKEKMHKLIEDFQAEFYRCEAEINACTSIEQVNAINANFPSELV